MFKNIELMRIKDTAIGFCSYKLIYCEGLNDKINMDKLHKLSFKINACLQLFDKMKSN